MSDCPHIHIQDSGLQAFREIIREKTDGGRTIVEFLNDAAEGSLPDFEPQHRLKASEILARYGFKKAAAPVPQHNDSKPKQSSSNGRRSATGAPALKKPDDRDPAIDDFAQIIRDETENGLSIVRNLIHTMETREHPYKPHHNLRAAKQLIDNGFPPTDALICRPDCTHHSAPAEGAAESMGADGGADEEPFDKEVWDGIIAELKQLEEDNNLDPHRPIPKVDMSIYMPPQGYVMPPEVATEEAAKFRAEIALRAERRKKWPEIEERRRKKLAKIYPSHSEEDPPET